MYTANRISVAIDGNTLLHNISLGFNPGELCVIVGPNGAGKTTLLKVLDGEITPDAGSVSFLDKELHIWNKHEIARLRSVLPQSSTLEFPFTVYDVVELGRLPHEKDKRTNEAVIKEVIRICDIEDLTERPYPYLSGGEQQRVQIARVLAQIWKLNQGKPGFLLLDEPLSALDLSHQYSLLNSLKKITTDQGVGIICILHNLNLAAQFSHRCVILDNGRLVADGAPMDVFTKETLSNVFDLDIHIQAHPDNKEIPLIIPRVQF